MTYEFHEAANAFPLMDEQRFAELVDDIRARGLLTQIQLYEGKILDGRNRYRACLAAGVEPQFFTVDVCNPFERVWSFNGNRRDLTADQRYLCFLACEEGARKIDEERARVAKQANAKRRSSARGNDNAKRDQKMDSAPTTSGRTVSGRAGAEAKAAAAGVHRGAVERMDRLVRERPDLAEKVRTGEVPAAAAVREMKREKVRERLEDVGAREAKAIAGVYDVLVIDPPWPMEKIERDERPNQVDFDYPTMTEDEMRAIPLPCADDCHVWIWTTHRFLPMAFRLLDAWALKYVCTFVWHKPGGFQPIGLPQYNCEFALYARRGSPVFIDTKGLPACFEAQRGRHSEKPEAFYDVVRRVTAGRRLDMFNRRALDGFDAWGKEAAA